MQTLLLNVQLMIFTNIWRIKKRKTWSDPRITFIYAEIK